MLPFPKITNFFRNITTLHLRGFAYGVPIVIHFRGTIQ